MSGLPGVRLLKVSSHHEPQFLILIAHCLREPATPNPQHRATDKACRHTCAAQGRRGENAGQLSALRRCPSFPLTPCSPQAQHHPELGSSAGTASREGRGTGLPCHLVQPAPLAIPAAAAEQPARSPLLLLRALQGLLGGCRAGCLFTFFSMALPQPALPQRGKGALGSSLGTTLKAEFQGFPRTRLLLWPSYICDSRKVSLAKKPTYTFIVLLDKIPILHSVY